MLRAQLIAKKVLDFIPRGAPNTMDEKNPNLIQTKQYLCIIRSIIAKVDETNFFEQTFPNLRNNHFKYQLLSSALRTVITKAYQCGNCGEQARLVLFEYLKSGLNMSFDLITVSGITKSSGEFDTHTLPILNRAASSDFSNPATWKNFFVNDTWGLNNEGPVFFPKGDSMTFYELTKNYFSHLTHKISHKIRIDKNLSAHEWIELAEFLKLAKQKITFDLLIEVFKLNMMKLLDVRRELKRIHDQIDSEIAVFQKLAVKPPAPLGMLEAKLDSTEKNSPETSPHPAPGQPRAYN